MKEVGLYIHIPFCKQKCLYCDFNSYVCNEEKVQSYIDAVLKEIRMYIREYGFIFKTIFFGGGTPTFIHYKHIEAIMAEIAPYVEAGAEISMECNPGTVNEESLKAYRAMGINRLSIGLQAWQAELQQKLGRIHDTEQFLSNFKQARSAGFENISVDLMFALPEQTLEMWHETVEQVAKLGVKHVSCYSLKIEEGTPFYKLYENDKLQLPEEEIDRAMYHNAIRLLEKFGLKQYEISNFAAPGYQCRHNLIYWENEEYLGIGAGSHSKLKGIRFNNFKALDSYMGSIDNGQYPIEERISIDRAEDMWESIILALRLSKGLNIDSFNKKYAADFNKKYEKALDKLMRNDLLVVENGYAKLTERGLDISNSVFIEFLEE